MRVAVFFLFVFGSLAQQIDYNTQIRNKPVLNPIDYTQTPGGSLSVGVNTITLAPCPLGIFEATNSTWSPVYISGGTGTAEVATPTGGTCSGATLGVGSGTITVTLANTHTGAWTVGSATAGIAEAIRSAGSGGAVILKGETYSIQTTILFPFPVSLRGVGETQSIIQTPSGFTSRVLALTNATSVEMSGFQINYPVASTANEAIYLSNVGNSNFHDIYVLRAYNGITLVASPGALDYFSNINLNVYNNGWQIGEAVLNIDSTWVLLNGTGATAGTCMTLGFSNQATQNSAFDQINCTNGAVGISIQNNATSVYGLTFNNMSIGGCTTCLLIAPTGTGSVGNVTISNSLFSSINQPSSTNAVLIQSVVSQNGVNDININGGMITAGPANCNGIKIDGAYGVRISGVTVNTNSNIGGIGIDIAGSTTPTQNLYITGSTIGVGTYMDGGIRGFATGIKVEAVSTTNIKIVGNPYVYGQTSAFVNSSTAANSVEWMLNGGIDDLNPAVASAATLTFPVNPNFTITGTTGVTAVAGLFQGSRGTFITTGGAVAFTSGATIGNSCTTTQNKPYSYWFDGTKVWIAGSGC